MKVPWAMGINDYVNVSNIDLCHKLSNCEYHFRIWKSQRQAARRKHPPLSRQSPQLPLRPHSMLWEEVDCCCFNKLVNGSNLKNPSSNN